jgi:hypothetical protein
MVARGMGRDPRSPAHVSVRLKSPLIPLVTGERGSFDLVARLREPEDPSAGSLSWNRDAENPLIVWISTSQDSGIRFLDPAHPDRPYHHLPIKFIEPARAGTPSGSISSASC